MTLVKQLRKCRDSRTLVEIYDDRDDWSSFSVGFIEAVWEETYVYSRLDDFAHWNGYRFAPIEDIEGIGYESRFLANSIAPNPAVFNSPGVHQWPKGGTMPEFLAYLQRLGLLIELCTYREETVQGRLLEVSDDIAILDVLDITGLAAGKRVVPLDRVNHVEFENLELKNLTKLYFD